MKKIFTLCFAAFSLFNAAIAQESIPYKANWIALSDADSDTNKGTPNANHSFWNLGGWVSVAENGDKPFYIPVTTVDGNKVHVMNSMEFVDNKQSKAYDSWLISPAIDLSTEGGKVVCIKAGKEKIENPSSNISIFYSTDYKGDITTATWTPVAESIIPADQAGLGISAIGTFEKEISLQNNNVVFGIKAHSSGLTAGPKQGKLRVMAFEINSPNSLDNVTDLGIKVYPNPVKDIININSDETIEKAEIFNVSGQNVLSASFTNQISVASLPAGYYILKVKLENGKAATHTFIKK